MTRPWQFDQVLDKHKLMVFMVHFLVVFLLHEGDREKIASRYFSEAVPKVPGCAFLSRNSIWQRIASGKHTIGRDTSFFHLHYPSPVNSPQTLRQHSSRSRYSCNVPEFGMMMPKIYFVLLTQSLQSIVPSTSCSQSILPRAIRNSCY